MLSIGFSSFQSKWIIACLILMVILVIFFRKGSIEAKALSLTRQHLSIIGWPAAMEGFSILHLSDLHFWERSTLAGRVLPIVQEANPDCIIITGDLLLPGGKGETQAWDFLAQLAQKWPIYVVPGNEDHQKRDFQHFREWPATGATVLINQAVPITRNDSRFWLAGVDDPHKHFDNLEAALQDIPKDESVILLAHSPAIIKRDGIERAAVVFSGHTHGGQICLPNGSALYTHTPLPRRYASGIHKLPDSDTTLVITRGAGTTRLHVRLWCPPEITLWSLKRQSIEEAAGLPN